MIEPLRIDTDILATSDRVRIQGSVEDLLGQCYLGGRCEMSRRMWMLVDRMCHVGSTGGIPNYILMPTPVSEARDPLSAMSLHVEDP